MQAPSFDVPRLASRAHNNHVVLLEAFNNVHGFLDQRIAADRREATLRYTLEPLVYFHRRHGCPNPMDSAIARDYWKDIVHKRVDGNLMQSMSMSPGSG